MGWIMGWTRKADPGNAGVSNTPVACCLGCGRVHHSERAAGRLSNQNDLPTGIDIFTFWCYNEQNEIGQFAIHPVGKQN